MTRQRSRDVRSDPCHAPTRCSTRHASAESSRVSSHAPSLGPEPPPHPFVHRVCAVSADAGTSACVPARSATPPLNAWERILRRARGELARDARDSGDPRHAGDPDEHPLIGGGPTNEQPSAVGRPRELAQTGTRQHPARPGARGSDVQDDRVLVGGPADQRERFAVRGQRGRADRRARSCGDRRDRVPDGVVEADTSRGDDEKLATVG